VGVLPLAGAPQASVSRLPTTDAERLMGGPGAPPMVNAVSVEGALGPSPFTARTRTK
jgi:hypothetical protein